MKDKRILFINSIVGNGSTGRIIEGLCDELAKRKADTLVCFGRRTAPERLNTYRIGNGLGVCLHGAASRITDRHGLYSSKATRELIKTIGKYGPDLIHLHNLHGYYLNYELLFRFLREYARPVLWTLHDCWTFTGHCTHFEYAGCERWKERCHDCRQLREYPGSILADASESNYRLKKELFTGISGMKLVTPSNWLKDKVAESFLREYPVAVIPTGIDLSQFKTVPSKLREKYGLGETTVILGVANPWRERKGLDDFIRLAGMLPEDHRLVMIGLKKSQLKLIPKNVIAITRTDSVREMAEWYSAADLHLNLTREDTFPTTNLEAMACGTPVFTYRAGGSPESIGEGCGRVFDTDDLQGVRDAVIRLGRKTPEIIQNCVEHAKLYDREVRFQDYIAQYEKILYEV